MDRIVGNTFYDDWSSLQVACEKRDWELLVPEEATRELLNAAIFDELCMGIFNARMTDHVVKAIEDLKSRLIT